MCGRFTLTTSAVELANLFDGLNFDSVRPRFNICPTQRVTCIRESDTGKREVVSLRWGLVPFWAKDLKIGARMINARSETVATKPAFRAAFKKRRCLVLADGFYEWQQQRDGKQPYYISQRDRHAFAMAGLWESWSDAASSDSPVETCTVLTTEANDLMAPLHDRMPVILPASHYDFWLDREFHDADRLNSWLVPCEADLLQAWPVDKAVNKPANDTPKCVEPVAN